MRNQIALFFSICILMACSTDKEIDNGQCAQKWQLTSMSGNIANVPPSTGDDMEWQEWYLLYANNTFTKTRTRDDVTTEEGGTYAIVTLSDGNYLELTYHSENNLIGNCTADSKELLRKYSDDKLTGTWSACDGPGLIYERVFYNCTGNLN
jgi:hypothetical protein